MHEGTYTDPGLCVYLRTINSTCVTDFTVCLFAVDLFLFKLLNFFCKSLALNMLHNESENSDCLCFLLGWPQSAKFIIYPLH